MVTIKSKKRDFSKADPKHLMAIVEDFNDKMRVTNEVNQNLNSLTKEFRDFRGEMVGFKEEMVGFKEDMTGFKSEMYSFRDEMVGFKEEMLDFKHETESSFKTLFHLLSQVDLIDLQERVVKIEKKLEMR